VSGRLHNLIIAKHSSNTPRWAAVVLLGLICWRVWNRG
jgi:hypothetical protein